MSKRPDTKWMRAEDDQLRAAFAQGMTIVLKIMSRDIVHKSDVGGVG